MAIDHDALERLRRLRSLGVRRGARDFRTRAPQAAAARSEPSNDDDADGQVPGEEVSTPFGPAWVRTARYAVTAHPALSGFLGAKPTSLASLGRDPALEAIDPLSTAFIDTETTGLSLGTGTYTFLIGVGTYDVHDGERNFVVRQFFMRHPGEERAQLHLVEEMLAPCTGLVSFNGRAFDLPLLHGRFTLAYMPPPKPGVPHLDLLPAARRVYRQQVGSCSLGDLERQVLGLRRTSADVPGWMIPGIYRDFYRQPGPETLALMARVFYHNLEDILSMARLAAHMAPLFDTDELSQRLAEAPPLQCASLARCYEALGWTEACEQAYNVALAGKLPPAQHSAVLRDFAWMLKRAGRRHEAAIIWETWISSLEATEITPFIELAKHHEWFTGDLAAARGWTGWAMQVVAAQPGGRERELLQADLARRLARLERKIGGMGGDRAEEDEEDL